MMWDILWAVIYVIYLCFMIHMMSQILNVMCSAHHHATHQKLHHIIAHAICGRHHILTGSSPILPPIASTHPPHHPFSTSLLSITCHLPSVSSHPRQARANLPFATILTTALANTQFPCLHANIDIKSILLIAASTPCLHPSPHHATQRLPSTASTYCLHLPPRHAG